MKKSNFFEYFNFQYFPISTRKVYYTQGVVSREKIVFDRLPSFLRKLCRFLFSRGF